MREVPIPLPVSLSVRKPVNVEDYPGVTAYVSGPVTSKASLFPLATLSTPATNTITVLVIGT
jgi:hypothetical protein